MPASHNKPNPTDKIHQICLDFLRTVYDRLGRPPRLGLAFSGGLDSSCLMAAMSWAQNQTKGQACLEIIAIHINHRLRPNDELLIEESKIVQNCLRFGLPLYYHELPLGSIAGQAKLQGIGIEESARKLRYNSIDFIKAQLQLDYIVLAHHADDQIELQLMRFFQGINDFGGMQEKRKQYYRPLLDLSRQELMNYAAERHLAWHEDSSNRGNDYLRNRIRNQIIPKVSDLFPGYGKALRRRAERSRMDEEFLQACAQKYVWRQIKSQTDQGVYSQMVGDFADFFNLHPAIRLRALRLACVELLKVGMIGAIPSYDLLEPLQDDSAWSKPGCIRQGEGIKVELSAKQIRIAPLIVAAIKKGYLIRVKQAGTLTIGNLGTFTVSRVQTGLPGFPLPCTIRSPWPGETLPKEVATLRRKYQDGQQFSDWPLIEVQGKVQGILAGPWLGHDIFFDFETFGDTPEFVGYTLQRKELGFST